MSGMSKFIVIAIYFKTANFFVCSRSLFTHVSHPAHKLYEIEHNKLTKTKEKHRGCFHSNWISSIVD